MIYKIAHKNEYSTDTSLVITVPGDELDSKALYTILTDKPKFILPFNYRNVGGQFEFVYQPGSQNKFQSISGVYSTKQYIELWHSLLDPLINCSDWFLTPYSFLLHSEHVYWDEEKKQVGYVYIPSLLKCSDYEALREMIIAFSSKASVDDPAVEVMVLRALMNGLNPKDFLRMIDSYAKTIESPFSMRQVPEQRVSQPPEQSDTKTSKLSTFDVPNPAQDDAEPVLRDDIIIKLPTETAHAKKQKKTLRDMGIPSAKKEKQKKKPKNPDSFFSRLRNSGSELIIDK
jgi:hypothetical protein